MYKLLFSPAETDAEVEDTFLDWGCWGKYSSYEEALIELMKQMLEDHFNKEDYAYRIVKVE